MSGRVRSTNPAISYFPCIVASGCHSIQALQVTFQGVQKLLDIPKYEPKGFQRNTYVVGVLRLEEGFVKPQHHQGLRNNWDFSTQSH